MKNKKIKLGFASILFLAIVFLIGYFVYSNYYKIDTRPFTYSFTSRIVESPDKQHCVQADICKIAEDSDTAYIMGTLGTLNDSRSYIMASTIFWQKVDSNSIKTKTINGETLDNWIDVAWLDDQTININGVTLNINDGYDYRRD